MKKVLLILLLVGSVVGCKKVAQPLPAGAINQTDANAYRTLADAHAAVTAIRTDVEAGKATLTPAQKTAFNDVINVLNIADTTYQQYHTALALGENPSTAALTTVLATLQSDLTLFQSLAGGK